MSDRITVNGVQHDKYFVQNIRVQNNNNVDRIQFFINIVKGKKVLHIGFVDYPITNLNNNLHLNLSPHCSRLDGYDINYKLEKELVVSNGKNYTCWDELPNDYDVILIPEVLEHVDNVGLFLKQVSAKNGLMVITAPDAFLHSNRYQVLNPQGDALEVVHPDHNYYYSPYTLKNVIEKYSIKRVRTLHRIYNHSIVAICE
jgi:hypothetical protein